MSLEAAGADAVGINCSVGPDQLVSVIRNIKENVSIPVIASGGAGKLEDFAEAFQETGCSAALAASLFHFGELTVQDVKADCRKKGILMR